MNQLKYIFILTTVISLVFLFFLNYENILLTTYGRETEFDDDTLQEISEEHNINYSALIDSNGSLVASYNGETEPAFATSIIKLSIAHAVSQAISNNTLSETDSITIDENMISDTEDFTSEDSFENPSQAVRLMLEESSNVATNALIGSLSTEEQSGFESINQILTNLGYSKTRIYNYIGTDSLQNEDQMNQIHAIEASEAFINIYNDNDNDLVLADTIQSALQNAPSKDPFQSKHSNEAGKYGLTSEVSGYSGILTTPEETYALTGYYQSEDIDDAVSSLENNLPEFFKDVEFKINGINTDSENESAPPSTNPSQRGSESQSGPVDYVSFTSFPGIGNIKTMCQLIAALWQLGFIVLFISVFGSFLYGGFLYTSAGVNAAQVNTAKGIFKNAAIALLLGLSVFIILNTLSPALVTGTCGVPSIDQAAVSSGGDNGGSPDLEGACDESYSIIDWKGNSVTELENIYPHWEGTGGYTAYKRDTSFDFNRVSYIGGRPNQLVYDFTVISGGEQREVPVPSPVSGTVTSAGGSMNAVNIKDSTGHVTRILHMRGLTVSSGDQVFRCDKIGEQSDKGSPGSVHIHIETTKPILDKYIQDLQ